MLRMRMVAVAAAAALLPGLALAQNTDTTRASSRDRQSQQDSSRNRMDNQGRRNAEDRQPNRVRGESRGSVSARGPRNLGLESSQVTMLQQALRDDGCDPGAIDGIVGPRTRRAIACAYRNHDLDGRNLNELFRELDLQFTVQDSLGVGGVMRSGSQSRARTGRETDADRNRAMDRDTSGNRSRGRDSTERPNRPVQRDTAQAGGRPPAR